MEISRRIRTAAILLAAGRGKRMHGSVAKQYMLLNGKPVLYYSLKAIEESRIGDVILVVGSGEEAYVRQEIVEKYGFSKVRQIVEGGRERYHSVYAGLLSLENLLKSASSADFWEAGAYCRKMASSEEEIYVFIHDGARPFLTQEIIERTYACVLKEKACAAGMPAKDTVKIADGAGYIADTPSRNLVWMIQTPQVFEYELIRDAYRELLREEASGKKIAVTDDAGVVERITEKRIKLVEGSYENIKITTPQDLIIAEAFLSKNAETF